MKKEIENFEEVKEEIKTETKLDLIKAKFLRDFGDYGKFQVYEITNDLFNQLGSDVEKV
jgi:hypothetical protein